jgi:hypothetical protein
VSPSVAARPGRQWMGSSSPTGCPMHRLMQTWTPTKHMAVIARTQRQLAAGDLALWEQDELEDTIRMHQAALSRVEILSQN